MNPYLGKTNAAVSLLIADDDEMDVELMKRFFRKENISNPIIHASNGVEALEILRGENGREKLARPFIIVMDINMPMMNGMEMLREIRRDEELKNSVVFILTTSPREEDKEAAYLLNIAGYFLKKDVNSLLHMLHLYWDINSFPE